jgi:hypothetical protein
MISISINTRNSSKTFTTLKTKFGTMFDQQIKRTALIKSGMSSVNLVG